MTLRTNRGCSRRSAAMGEEKCGEYCPLVGTGGKAAQGPQSVCHGGGWRRGTRARCAAQWQETAQTRSPCSRAAGPGGCDHGPWTMDMRAGQAGRAGGRWRAGGMAIFTSFVVAHVGAAGRAHAAPLRQTPDARPDARCRALSAVRRYACLSACLPVCLPFSLPVVGRWSLSSLCDAMTVWGHSCARIPTTPRRT
jgi:hypothetical protein